MSHDSAFMEDHILQAAFMTPISVMGLKLSFKLLLKYGKNPRSSIQQSWQAAHGK